MRTRILLFVFLTLFSLLSSAEAPANFSKTKKVAANLYRDHQQSFYCGCIYEVLPKANGRGKKLTPYLDSCGYKIRKQPARANRIEWEHVMPAHHFGQHLQCWREGGRKNCKKDPQFRKMEADLHNLVPAIGEVNGDRSNFKFGLIEGPSTQYGACPMKIDFKTRRAEPPEQVRGDIARIYFYMARTYNIRLSDQQRKLFEAWDKQDPEAEWERIRRARIESIIAR